MKRIAKIILLLLVLGLVTQAGFTAIAAVNNILSPSAEKMYSDLIQDLKVTTTYKNEMDRLIAADYALPDILVAYEYLYHNFGRISELEDLVRSKGNGKSWDRVLADYQNAREPFVPREFDSRTLERLMNIPALTPDDIMIADQYAHVTGRDFDTVLDARLNASNWASIASNFGVLYTANTLPRVQITESDMQKYKAQGLSDEKIILAFVLAGRLDLTPKSIIDMVKAGKTESAIVAEMLQAKYN